MSDQSLIIQTEKLSKSFVVGEQVVPVLHEVSFEVYKGEFLVIFGPSGCGKSTLLHVLLGLESPSSGRARVMGRNIYDLDEDQLADFRKIHVGMVYQQSNWVRALNVLENVALPLALLRIPEQERNDKALQMLKMLQMEKWALYQPSELSSGQQQRVSLARAMISNPEIIIADEPTGNLDFESGQELMELLKKISKETQKTILMVTHDLEYMRYADQAIRMRDGQIVEEFSAAQAQQFLKKQQFPDLSKKQEKYE